ncbi:serine/threonine-protein phosphatase 6 regulatory ankyrin repeat subunit B-like isoform X2 [Oscarella lobularis]
MPSFPLASRRAARSASTSFSKSETDLTTTRSVQAYQDVLSPRKTKLVPAQPPETSLKRETLTVFIPPGYKKDLLQMEEALEKLVRKHLKLFLNLRFLNPDDSSKPEKSLILAASNIVNISLVFIGMSALDFEGKELSNEFLSLLIGVFPKLRIEVSSVESDVVEFCAQMFSKDILSLLEFFDDEPLQQAFAACLWYQFSSLKEMRVRIDCLPQWTLDIEKSRQLHEDFPREEIISDDKRIDAFALVAAAKSKKKALLKALLKMGASPNALHKGRLENWRSLCESTPLHYACLIDNEDGVNRLIKYRADVNRNNSLGVSPLILAAYKGSLAIVKALILAGADVPYEVQSTSDVEVELCHGTYFVANRCNAFHMACLSGNISVVEEIGEHFLGKLDTSSTATGCFGVLGGSVAVLKYLRENGCSFTKPNDFGNYPLHCCCLTGEVHAAAFLYYEGLIEDINQAGNNGISPLWAAAHSNCPYLATFLLAKGANIESTDKDGNTSLMNASDEGNVEVIKVFCEWGCDVNKKGQAGQTALHLACYKGHSKVTSALLERGADVEIRDEEGRTPFLCGCASGNKATLVFLSNANCTMTATDKNGDSGLHLCALFSDSEECVIWLLEHASIAVNLRSSDGQTALHVACYKGDSNVASALLKRGADVEISDENGLTPFLCGCASGDKNTLIVLSKANCTKTATDKNGDSGLHLCAVSFDSEDCVLWLLEHAGIEVNLRNRNYQTALHLACSKGHSKVASALLERGADVEISDESGSTPFLCGCASGDKDTLVVLSKANCTMAATDKNGDSGLHLCAVFGSNSDECLAWLLEHAGIEVNLRNRNGQTALHRACRNGHSKVASALLERGADVEIRDENSWTPFLCGCASGNKATLVVLSKANCTKTATDKDGDSGLHLCAYFGSNSDECVVWLLEHSSIEVNLRNRNGQTALHYACRNGLSKVASALLERGADVEISDVDGRTPFHGGCTSGDKDTLVVLGKANCTMTATDKIGDSGLHMCAYLFDSEECVIWLLEHAGLEVNLRRSNGQTALHLACYKGHSKVASALVERGADVEKRDESGWTPFLCGCASGDKDTLVVLSKANCTMTATNKDGDSGLHLCADSSDSDKCVVWLLEEGGIEVNLRNHNGQTALHHACRRGHSKVASALLEGGADVEISYKDGRTPFLCGCASGDKDTLVVLSKANCTMTATNKDSISGLHLCAVSSDSEDCVVWLLEHAGIEINLRKSDGQTALHVACYKGHSKVASALLEGGADVEMRDENGWTPFLCGCASGDKNTLVVLGKANCKMTATDKNGDSGLHVCAVSSDSEDCVVWLLEHAGIEVNLRNRDGKTAFHQARSKRHSKVASALLQRLDKR